MRGRAIPRGELSIPCAGTSGCQLSWLPLSGSWGSTNDINITLERFSALAMGYYWSFSPQSSRQHVVRGRKGNGLLFNQPLELALCRRMK